MSAPEVREKVAKLEELLARVKQRAAARPVRAAAGVAVLSAAKTPSLAPVAGSARPPAFTPTTAAAAAAAAASLLDDDEPSTPVPAVAPLAPDAIRTSPPPPGSIPPAASASVRPGERITVPPVTGAEPDSDVVEVSSEVVEIDADVEEIDDEVLAAVEAETDGATAALDDDGDGEVITVNASEAPDTEVEAIEADAAEVEAIEADAAEVEAIEADAAEVEAIEADAAEAEAIEADAVAEAVEADAAEAEAIEAEALEAEALEVDESQEPVRAANEIEEPAPSSSPRPIEAAAPELDDVEESAPRHTPPPESGKQVAAASQPPSHGSSVPPSSIGGHTLIGGWVEPGLGGPPKIGPGSMGVRVPSPISRPPVAQTMPPARSSVTPPVPGDVMKPELPATANVAAFQGTAPESEPATFGDLLDTTLSL